MAIPFSLRLPAAVVAPLFLTLALPAVSDAHGGEIHGERHEEKSEASEAESPSETVTPVPAEPTASTTPASTTKPPAAKPLDGGEIVGALIFTAPFALTFLKRRAQAKAALR